MASDTWYDLREKRDETVNHALEVAMDLITQPSGEHVILITANGKIIELTENEFSEAKKRPRVELDKREAEKSDLATDS